jgi:hypothetical protein
MIASFTCGWFRAALAGLLALGSAASAAEVKPLRVLLITGGCCHDYNQQKDLLKRGLEERANVRIDQVHSTDRTTRPPLAIFGQPDYAGGYDLVIHDECAADISDPAVIEAVLKPHRDGIPAVNLHCAMHSYRIGKPSDPAVAGTPRAAWFEYLGLQSSSHGPQEPIDIAYTNQVSAITRGFSNWTTIPEELYNNVRLFPSARPLAHGKQSVQQRDGSRKVNETVVVWTNEFGDRKTRVFSTTLGHHNATVADSRYLNLVARGLLWAAGRLNDDGTPAPGYGPGGK